MRALMLWQQEFMQAVAQAQAKLSVLATAWADSLAVSQQCSPSSTTCYLERVSDLQGFQFAQLPVKRLLQSTGALW